MEGAGRPVPGVEVLQEAADFSFRNSLSIRTNFSEVSLVREVLVSMRLPRTAFSLATDVAILLRWLSSCSDKAAVRLGGSTDATESKGMEAVLMSWMAAAELVLPKTSQRLPDALCLRSTVFWAPHYNVFHLSQLFLAAGFLSQSGCNLGKFSSKRRDYVTMSASHALVMGGLDQRDWGCMDLCPTIRASKIGGQQCRWIQVRRCCLQSSQ